MRLKEAWGKREEGYAAYHIPSYDRQAVRAHTLKAPVWLHFGAGNIFRAFMAAAMDSLLEQGQSEKGIIVCEDFDKELVQRVYEPYDSLSLLVTLKADGTVGKRVVGSVMEAVTEESRMKALFCMPSVQMVSFTVTEKGYTGPLMPKIAEFCLARYESGAFPITLVSMDNCARNGEVLANAVMKYAKALVAEGMGREGFLRYLKDPAKVAFPWTVIDKITPRPDASVKRLLEKDGFEDTALIVTPCQTYTAPFVNAEETEYLAIEDTFPNGRPSLDYAGVWFTDRETVDRFEKMKVGACLNPLHTALAVFGCLLEYETIHDEMGDETLKKLVWNLGYTEGLPIVASPGIIKPQDFLNDVLEKRLPNPFMPDSPQRIATDTSQKIPVRFGQTLKAYATNPRLNVHALVYIPLVIAGWLRYLTGVNDKGEPFILSPDPRLEELRGLIKDIRLGQGLVDETGIDTLLRVKDIFVIDLFSCGLADKIKGMLEEMLVGPGAVYKTLQKYCG